MPILHWLNRDKITKRADQDLPQSLTPIVIIEFGYHQNS